MTLDEIKETHCLLKETYDEKHVQLWLKIGNQYFKVNSEYRLSEIEDAKWMQNALSKALENLIYQNKGK